MNLTLPFLQVNFHLFDFIQLTPKRSKLLRKLFPLFLSNTIKISISSPATEQPSLHVASCNHTHQHPLNTHSPHHDHPNITTQLLTALLTTNPKSAPPLPPESAGPLCTRSGGPAAIDNTGPFEMSWLVYLFCCTASNKRQNSIKLSIAN